MRLAALQTAIVYGVLLAGGICLAQQTVTVKGVTYVGAELIKEYPQSAYIKHVSGRKFVNKADLSADDARALGVTNPITSTGTTTDPFQRLLDKDFQDLESGKRHVPAVPRPLAQHSSTPQQPKRPITPRPTPHPSSIAAVQQEFNHFVKHGSLPQPPADLADSRRAKGVVLPDQPWMGEMDASSVRLKLFQKGFLPLKRSEFSAALGGQGLSPSSDVTALDAVKAAQVMLGQLGPEHLPPRYKKLLRRSAPSKARAPSDKNRSSETVSGFDHSGNFYEGSIGPSGTFSGFRQGPSGSSIISGNFDHNGGFVSPY